MAQKRKKPPGSRRKSYPGHLERRGENFRWCVSVGGRRHAETVETSDVREAEQYARTKYAELEREASRWREGMPVEVRLSALLDQFEREELPALAPGAQRAYKDSLLPIRTFFVDNGGDPRVDKVRGADIHAYMTWRRAHGMRGGTISNRTVAKDRAVLHRIFALADRLEYRDGNPVRKTKAPKSDGRDPIILTPDEYERLLKASAKNDMLHLYVLLLGETGARAESEALWLRWEDVDLETGFLWFASGRDGHRTKSGKGRSTPMTDRLTSAMREHFARYRFARYADQQAPWVFHHRVSRCHHKAGMRIQSFYDGFKAAAERAKLPKTLRQHDLRHRRVTTWLAEGHNPVHVKEAVGHSDLRTTMSYTHLAREHLKVLVSPRGPVPKDVSATSA